MVIRFILTVFLCSCTTVVIEYPSVCPDGQPKCQRNLDAQTLSIIGKEKAALTLMCMDPDLNNLLDIDCLRE